MMTVKMMSSKILWHYQSCKIFGTQVGNLISSESCTMRTFCTLLSVHMIYHPEDVENTMKNEDGFGLFTHAHTLSVGRL